MTKTERELFPQIWAQEIPEPPEPVDQTWGALANHMLKLRQINEQHNADKRQLQNWRDQFN